MRYTDNAMSAILLCSYLGLNKDSEIKPLTQNEWNLFIECLIKNNSEPRIVLEQNCQDKLQQFSLDANMIQRIEGLVARGGSVAFELDDLSRKGIEITTIFDKEYPVLLRKRLKKKAPIILYYAGDITLSSKIGIAVVGSRNVNEEGINFTRELVKKASAEHMIIYSGGARGVDSVSELTAIENGSAVVSYIADSLLAKIKKREVIQAIQENRLLLISDVKPDTGFTAARAMNRNKYVYASSYGAFVIASDYNKGGTWAGAIENLKNDWVKTFVWKNQSYVGNCKLIEKGANPYELTEERIYDLIMKKKTEYQQQDLFSYNSNIQKECVMKTN